MKNLKVSSLVRQFGSIFGFFRYRWREYFDTLKSFCCFWALDMAPTWAVSGLFVLSSLYDWASVLVDYAILFAMQMISTMKGP